MFRRTDWFGLHSDGTLCLMGDLKYMYDYMHKMTGLNKCAFPSLLVGLHAVPWDCVHVKCVWCFSLPNSPYFSTSYSATYMPNNFKSQGFSTGVIVAGQNSLWFYGNLDRLYYFLQMKQNGNFPAYHWSKHSCKITCK